MSYLVLVRKNLPEILSAARRSGAALIVGALLLLSCQQKPISAKAADDKGATPEGISAVVRAQNQFAFELYSQINKNSDNIFFSPYSMSNAMAMVYEGARGKTAEEIRNVFHYPNGADLRQTSFAALFNQLNKLDSKVTLLTANGLWAEKRYKFLDGYLSTIEKYYAGKAENVDFVQAADESRTHINRWVENKTNDKIKDLFSPGTIDANTRLVLVNAIYFKGKWIKLFDKKNTKEEDFHTNSGKIKVPMMRLTGGGAQFKYAETDDIQILEMPYEGDQLSMLVLLPKQGVINSIKGMLQKNGNLTLLEQALTLEKLEEWKSKTRSQWVDVYMPKFTFEIKYTLNETLQKMGMPLAFKYGADFSGMDGTKDLYIGIVVHKAFVDVNEEGAEAAAATGVSMQLLDMPATTRYSVFRVDHPFLFLIQDQKNGNILFMGRVTNPVLK